jgi:hypothetical protein
MFPDFHELPYLVAGTIVGLVLGAFELGRVLWWLAHHVSIVW